MQINIVYKDTRYAINVSDTQKLRDVKVILSKILNLDFHFNAEIKDGDEVCYVDEKSYGKFLLYYNGNILNDNCSVSELGLTSGSTVRCREIRASPHVLKIRVVTLSYDIELRDEISIETTTVGEVRSILQNRIGIPISTFKLRQINSERDMFDNHFLIYYGIKHGDVLILEILKNLKELIIHALDEDILKTLYKLPSFHDNPIMNRYHLKVTLFIAAHFDLAKLATHVLEYGIRCDDPVGEYPSRQWCLRQSHRDVFKTPVHQAATQGSLRTLNIFLRHSPSMMVAQDGFGRSPSIYALKNGHIECWKFLMMSQFQFQNKCGFSLVIYAKIMRWCHKARERLLYFKFENKKQSFLLSQPYLTDSASLGDPIVISGYHSNQLDICENKKITAWSSNMRHGMLPKPTGFSEKARKLPMSNIPRVSSSKDSLRVNESKADKIVPSNRNKERSNTSFNTSSLSGKRNMVNDKNMLIQRGSNRQNAQVEARNMIYELTGKSSTQIANECYQIGQMFDKMSWKSQMKIALKCSANYIGRYRHDENEA